jgi:hypothetical protein
LLGSESPQVWRKSTRCESGACVEVAITGEGVKMRDSKNPDGFLTFSRDAWSDFMDSINRGDLQPR